MPYIVAENLCETYGFGWSYGGTAGYEITNLIDSRNYTKFISNGSMAWDVCAYDGESRIDANCVVIWSDTDDPDCTVDVRSGYGYTPVQVFTGINKGVNFYQFTLQEDSPTINVYFTQTKTLTLRHLWISKYYQVNEPVYNDPESETLKSNIIQNKFGNVIYRDYQANHYTLNCRFNNISVTQRTAFEELRDKAWREARAFWYLSDTTTGRLYRFDKSEFMLAYQKGILKSCTIQATSVMREIENTLASAPTTQGTSLTFGSVTETSMNVSWTNASEFPDGYLVVMKSGSAPAHDPDYGSNYEVGQTFSDGSIVKYFGVDNSVSVTGLSSGTTYYFKVYSYNAKKMSWAYNTTSPLAGSQATSSGALGTPTLLTPTAAYVTADLTTTFDWSDVVGATSYRIQIATDSGFSTVVETGTPSSSTYTSSGLSAGQTYYWRVRAEAGASYGDYTTGRELKTLGTVTLDTPADASFTSDTTPTFNWNAATNATGYIMELATDSGFSTIIQTYTGANTTYTATTIATDGWLYWRVRPTAESGAEVGSNTTARSLELFNNRYCVVLDGSNDYASKSGISQWRNQSKWEFCGNIQVDDKSANTILFTAYYNTSNRISIIIVDNAATSQFKVRANVNASTQYIESGLLDYGTKYFVYFGFDGTQSAGSRYLLYINNVSNGTITGTEPTAVGNAGDFTFYVGSSNTGTTFNYDGKIDHWAVRYNRTLLTSTERGNAYNSGNMRRYQDVATFDSIWDMNENTGTTMNDDGADNLDITFAGPPSTPTRGTWQGEL